jgi:hypothetical protein
MGMPSLTRRRDPDARQERRRVFYGDVQVGTIGMRSGVPVGVDQWDWTWGFYPGSDRQGAAMMGDKAWLLFSAVWIVTLTAAMIYVAFG